MITVAVLDDIPQHAKTIENGVSAYFKAHNTPVSIERFTDPSKLISRARTFPFEIAVIDIKIGKETATGIDAARQINEISPRTAVIFVSGYDEFFLDVYEARHVYLVPKARFSQVLPKALKKALAALDDTDEIFIPITVSQKVIMVPASRIRYIEKNLRKMVIHADQDYECYGKLDELLAETEVPWLFQCHRSFVINLDMVTLYEKRHVTLSSGEQIPVSKPRTGELIERLTNRKNASA